MKWAEDDQASHSFGYEPTFSDLTDFITREANVVNSRSRQIAEHSLLLKPNISGDRRRDQHRIKVFANPTEEINCRF